jgi:hypothetical protein
LISNKNYVKLSPYMKLPAHALRRQAQDGGLLGALGQFVSLTTGAGVQAFQEEKRGLREIFLSE